MKIVISNLLLTRLCPLSCENCRISKDYIGSPYPSIDSYGLLAPKEWLKLMDVLENMGCVFHTIYGGEPILYPQMEELIKLLNERNKCYTFITSGCHFGKWLDFHKKCGIKGVSASIDIVYGGEDRKRKSEFGEGFLFMMKSLGVKDVVAVTVLDELNIQNNRVLNMVKRYTDRGVYVEITLIDNPKSKWYDFAEDVGLEISSMDKFRELMDGLMGLKKEGYLIHNNIEWFEAMKNIELNKYKCNEPWTSLTVEPDGTLRLCYRIGGKRVRAFKVFDLRNLSNEIQAMFVRDMEELCEGCSPWNCVWMSEFLKDKEDYCKSVFRHNQ